jgi:hypothetical protein
LSQGLIKRVKLSLRLNVDGLNVEAPVVRIYSLLTILNTEIF